MRVASKAPFRRRTPLPRALRAAVHAILAVALFFGMVHAGSRYFYCEALGLLPTDPCAQAPSDDHGKSPLGTVSERTDDCCEVITLAAMPRAAQATGFTIAPAACVAVLPALGPASAADLVPSAPRDRAFDRWRPPPRAPNDARAQLMVFLI